MNNHCYSPGKFQARIDILVTSIANIQREMEVLKERSEVHKKQLRSIAMEHDCNNCEHRLECITTEEKEKKNE